MASKAFQVGERGIAFARAFQGVTMQPIMVMGAGAAPAIGQERDMAAIIVDDVEGLYAAVNDPGSANTTIRLRPGIYQLTPTAPNGLPRENGGSLVLQPGMTLRGRNQYVDHDADGVPDARVGVLDNEGRDVYADPQTQTVIDGDALNVVGQQNVVWGAIVIDGPIQALIRNLTVRGGPRAQAAIDVRGRANAETSLEVRDCILEKGRRGIVLDALPRWGSANARIELVAKRNVIRDHRVDHLPGHAGVHFGWGVHAQTGRLSGFRLSLRLRHNRFSGNKIGLFLEVTGGQDGEVKAASHGNIYEHAVLTQDPTIGYVYAAGIVMTIRGEDNAQFGNKTERHRARLVSRGDAIWNNAGFSGLFVEGIRRTTDNADMSDNEIEIKLLRTRFVKRKANNAFDGLQNWDARTFSDFPTPRRRDILVIGANNWGNGHVLPPPGGFTGAGCGNRVDLLMRHTTSSRSPLAYDADPRPFMIVDNEPGERSEDVV